MSSWMDSHVHREVLDVWLEVHEKRLSFELLESAVFDVFINVLGIESPLSKFAYEPN